MTALEAFAAGRLAEAVALQEAAVAAQPANPPARLALAELLLFTGRLDEVRSHLAIIESDDPAWPASARVYRGICRAASRRDRRPLFVPDPPPDHAKARWMAIRALRLGEPQRALKWSDRADNGSPPLRGFVDGREFEELRDADDRFASVLEAFHRGRCVWFPWEAIRRVKLEPAKYLLDRFARPASVRLATGEEWAVHLPLIYPGSHDADGEFAVGFEMDYICPDDGPVRCIGGRVLLADEDEVPLADLTMIELR
jgi:type VI secretion system protein ImpE